MAKSGKYRWGFDLGTNSIGWCVLALDENNEPVAIERLGSRIFSDGRNAKDKQPLAVARREARQMRKQRDRKKRRLQSLRNTMARFGLFPKQGDKQKRLERDDPWQLRARGLDEKLEPFELGRALYHLAMRRGFQSNRKSDRKADDGGEIFNGGQRLQAAMRESGARTIGEWCAKRVFAGKTARARTRTGGKAGDKYEFYPLRDLTRAEFNALWTKQSEFHPEQLTIEAAEEIAKVLFHQRPLKPVEAGKCTFVPEEHRLPKSSPLFQQFRLLQELNHLQVIDRRRNRRPLTLDERNLVRKLLTEKSKLTFQKLRKALELESDDTFSIESDARGEMLGDEVQSRLSDKKRFGDRWWAFSEDEKELIAERIEHDEDEAQLVKWLQQTYALTEEAADAVASVTLPSGYGRVGMTATRAILRELEAEVITYSEAAKRAGFHHSDFRPGEPLSALPYYGEVLARHVMPPRDVKTGDADADQFGKIANPTVHIALNQLRKITNALLELYGNPAEVAIEVARDLKMSEEQKRDFMREQAENKKANDMRAEKLREHGITVNSRNLQKMQLWEALDPKDALARQCVFTGERVSFSALFSDDSPFEIEHLLPFSRTLDDSRANKVLAHRRANRDKGNRSPYEAFGKSENGYNWDEILARANRMKKSTRWRFEADAMKRFEEKEGFLTRQLNDTRYLSRVAGEYMKYIAADANQVWVSPGKMTAWLRRKWNVNEILAKGDFKNRDDHRHHAVDAFVIAVTSRSLLNKVAKLSERFENEAEDRLGEVPDPWPGFREALKEKIARVIVSHRVDHGKQGGLHLETAYGFSALPEGTQAHQIVTTSVITRKPLDETTFKKLEDLEKLRSESLRKKIERFVKAKHGGNVTKESLADFRNEMNVRHVRVVDEKKTVVVLADSAGVVRKGYEPGSNYCYEIYEYRTKRGETKWDGEVISLYHANQKSFTPRWKAEHPAARKVMRLHNDDCVGLFVEQEYRVFRVVRMTDGQIGFAEHREGGSLANRNSDPADPFKLLRKGIEPLRKELKMIGISVDVLGRVRGLPKVPKA